MSVIDEVFDSAPTRIDELKRNSIAIEVVLHETGHILVAKHCGLLIRNVHLPALASYADPNDKDFAGVEVSGALSDSNKLAYYLGGLFGEMSPYSDDYLREKGTILYVSVRGALGDMKEAAKLRGPIALSIRNALVEWDRQQDSRRFLADFLSFSSTNLTYFRLQRDEHRKLAVELYSQWENADFAAIDTIM